MHSKGLTGPWRGFVKRQPELVTSTAEFTLAGLGLVSGVITARVLMPVGKGTLTAVLLWFALLNEVGSVGVSHALIHYTGRWGPKRAGRAVGTAVALAALQGPIVLAAGYVLAPVLLAGYDKSAIHAAQVLFFFSPVSLAGSHLQRVVHGSGDFPRWNALRVGRQLFYAAGVTGMAALGALSVTTAVWIYAATDVALLIMVAAVLRGCLRQLSVTSTSIRETLSYGIRNLLASLTGQANLRGDQAVISLMLPASSLGLYRVALSVAGTVGLVSAGFQHVVITQTSQTNDAPRAYALLWQAVRRSAIASSIAALACVILAPVALSLVFGDAYRPASGAARVLCVAMAVYGTKEVAYNAIRGLGRPSVPLWCELVGLVVTVAGLVVLLPILGIMGAAVASVAAYVASLVAVAGFQRRRRRSL